VSGRAVNNPKAQQELETALRQFEMQAVNWGYRWINDSGVRKEYLTRTKQFSDEIRASYNAGKLSSKQAADAANEMRNQLMEFARLKSSDVGHAKELRALLFRCLDDGWTSDREARAIKFLKSLDG
jgi:hypothetical protein